MNIYQSGEYLANNPFWHSEDSAWKAGQIAQIIKKNAVQFSSVVEVGCGAGHILAELHKGFPHVQLTGFDISSDASAFWSDLPAQIHMNQSDFLAAERNYDLLLSIDVFEHVRDYMGFLEALRPRADHHVFHIPLELSAQGIVRDIPMQTRQSVGHLHYFSKTTALATLKDCGYRIVDYRYANAALDCAPTLRAKVLNVIRRPLFAVAPELTSRILGGWSLLVLTAKE